MKTKITLNGSGSKKSPDKKLALVFTGLIVLFILFAGNAFSVTTYWQYQKSGNWDDQNWLISLDNITFTPTSLYPCTSEDNVFIYDIYPYQTITVNIDINIGSLNIGYGNTVIVNSGNILGISIGEETNYLQIEGGGTLINNGTLNISSGISAEIADNGYFYNGGTLNISGTMKNNYNYYNYYGSDNGITNIALTGTFTNDGNEFHNKNGLNNCTINVTGTFDNKKVLTEDGTINIKNKGTYKHGFDVTAGTIPAINWESGSTCKISGYTTNTSAPSGLDQTFYNFVWNCPGQLADINLNGKLRAISGDFTVSSGSVTLVGPSAINTTLSVDGSFILSGGTLGLNSDPTKTANLDINNINNYSTDVIFNSGSLLSSERGNVNFKKIPAYGTVKLSIPNAPSISGNISFIVINGTILEFENSGTVLSGSCNFTVEDGGGLKIVHPDGIETDRPIGCVQVSGTKTFSSAGKYEYSGYTTQYTGEGLPALFTGVLTITNPYGVNLSKNITLNSSNATLYVNFGGKLLCNGHIIDGAGKFYLFSGSTITLCSAEGITTSGPTGNVQTAVRSFHSSANYEYGGSVPQVTGNALPSSVNGLVINNFNGVTLTNPVSVSSTYELKGGYLLLGNNNLTMGENALFTGSFDASHMIVTNGMGEIRKYQTGSGAFSFTFPLGDINGTAEYSPATLNFTSGVYGVGAYVGMKVTNAKHPGNTSTTHYLNRYWNISQNSFSSFNCNVVLNYTDGDVVGTESNIWCGKYNSSWTLLDPANVSTNTLTGQVTSFSSFTGGEVSVMPVNLAAFTANTSGNIVNLKWVTSIETNNKGFEIQRQYSQSGTTYSDWQKAGFVDGKGNVTTPTNYSFSEKCTASGKYKYRLKQIDFNGNFEFHNLSDIVEVGPPKEFRLSQNYPNPFNPVTKMDVEIATDSKVIMKIYDISGREINTLINQNLAAGYYTYTFDGSQFATGMYFCRLTATSNGNTKTFLNKMMLIK